ncbi:hypothetical protein [Leifsonia sp. AG29]|uniref:hypothetical protein n=1 Tax=Leifsonia sp. AG29 TaxID=2598860 RepID=UPI00131CFDDA|nr:hypothetical protein [Leifsonia sp. AG29]
MEFDFRLRRAGWAYADVRYGVQSAHVTASYLSDALGDLLRAVEGLLDGAAAARCFWSEEPGAFWWQFEKQQGRVRLQIIWFGTWVDEPDATGVVKFDATMPLRELAQAIAEGAAAVLARHGTGGYYELWMEDQFPSKLLEKIQTRLSRARA